MTARYVLLLATLGVALMLLPTPVYAQATEEALSIGRRLALRSRVMDEEREVLVALPESYSRTAIGYPVLFVLDGSSHLLHATATTRFLASARNRIPEMIVVAVPNTNRNRDLTPGPGAARMQRFFADELIPWVDSSFRTVPERVIMGHSLGGSFVTHTLLNRPELFDFYVAVSAPLWRYDSLSRDMRTGLARAATAGKTIHLMVGEHENAQLRRGVADFVSALRSADKAAVPRWSYSDLRDEDHNSTSQRSLYAALESYYAPFRFPFFEESAELDSLGGLKGMQAHYARFAEEFAYLARPPEARVLAVTRIYLRENKHADARQLALTYRSDYPVVAEQIINMIGYDLIRRGDLQRALQSFKENTELFPRSPNVFDSLADSYCRLGNVDAARASMRQAVRVAEAQSHPRVARYRQRADRPCE